MCYKRYNNRVLIIYVLYALYMYSESPKNKLLVEQSLRTISFYAQSRGLLPDQIEQLLCHIGSCQKGGTCYMKRDVYKSSPA